ncbi:hypothetical protein SVAN01_09163 [Stagonosporopsis vannaccii]|nr:hypothetical protein SVAN01_09163 [Stagonosporopsis vannaccii]
MQAFPYRSSSYASDESFDILRRWIEECNSEHDHEHCSGAAQTLPTRLIAVGTHQDEPCLKLVEPSPGQRGQYIALSHCWGTIAISTTTTLNLEARKQSIHPEELPATFLDAISCARKLGVSYLWIDSLCIIQDNALDWQMESAKMCDYYQNAWLVVVAASAKGDTEGFLTDRAQEHRGIPVESCEASGHFDMCIRHTDCHKTKAVSSRTDLYGDCTSSRAWCLQEVMLARRSATFHKSELVWACHAKCDCECRKASYNYNSTVIRTGHLQSLATQIAPIRKDLWHYAPANHPGTRFADPSIGWSYSGLPFATITSFAALYEEWRCMVVPLYTNREMTKRTDKFPALSGLAQLVGSHQKGRYIAGIWANDVQLGLLWEIKKRTERPAIAEPLAPSFSWASVNQQVVYNTPGHVALQPTYFSLLGSVNVELVGDDIETVGGNPYGQVIGGSITLNALATRVHLSLEDGKFDIVVCSNFKLWRDARGRSPSSFQADTYLEETSVFNDSGKQETTMRRSTGAGVVMPSADIELDCIVVADIRTPSQPSTYLNIDKDCEEYAVIVLGRNSYGNKGWRYERLGKAVLVFEPGEGARWLSEAERREIVIC